MQFTQRFFYEDGAAENGGGSPKKTKEQIDFINNLRTQAGEEPLSYEHDEQKVTNENDKVEDDKPATVIAADGVIRIGSKKKEETPAAAATTQTEDEIDEEKALKFLSKKTGKTITSLDEFLTPKADVAVEDKEAKEQERENAMISFALQNKKISKREIEAFIEDTKNPSAVVFNFYAEQQRSIDQTLTDEDIQYSFESRFALNEDKDSREYKVGQKELNYLANTLIQNKHPKYLSLNSEYTAYEQAENAKAQARENILSKAPVFKKDVEQVRDNLKKFKVNLSDTESYELEIEDDVIQPYVDQMLTPEFSSHAIQKGYTLADLETNLKSAIIVEHFESMVKGVVEADRIKTRAGLQGVIPNKNRSQQKNVYTPAEQAKVDDLKKRLGVEEHANSQTAN